VRATHRSTALVFGRLGQTFAETDVGIGDRDDSADGLDVSIVNLCPTFVRTGKETYESTGELVALFTGKTAWAETPAADILRGPNWASVSTAKSS